MNEFYHGQEKILIASCLQVCRFLFKFKACYFFFKCKTLKIKTKTCHHLVKIRHQIQDNSYLTLKNKSIIKKLCFKKQTFYTTIRVVWVQASKSKYEVNIIKLKKQMRTISAIFILFLFIIYLINLLKILNSLTIKLTPK